MVSGCAGSIGGFHSKLGVADPKVDVASGPAEQAQAGGSSPYRLVSAENPSLHGDRIADQAKQLEASVFSGSSRTLADDRAASQSLQPRDANSQPNHFRPISEDEMLAQAFACSPVLRQLGIRILDNPAGVTTIYDRAITASDPFFGPQAALAEFDSAVSASVMSQNNDRVFNNVVVGGGAQELVQDVVEMNSRWQRRTPSGAIWEINHLTYYDDNNRAGNLFPNFWETNLEAGVRQPLLQGGGKQFNLIAGPNAQPGFNFSNGIVVAQINTQVSGADFEIGVQSFVQDLYTAYWNLVRHYQTYESVLAARDLSYRTWQSVLAKNKAKLSGGEANKEAQARAKYYRYCREVQVALGGDSGREGLYAAERRLRQMIGLPLVDKELLRPVDSPSDVRIAFDYDSMVSRAMSQRTELKRQSLLIRQQQLRLLAAKNFLLPQLDFISRYRLRGFGDDLMGDGPRFSSAYQDFFSFDHQELELGFEMGLVVGRRQAHAAVRNATWKLTREQAILREQQRSIQHQVSDAIAEVSSAYYAMQSSLAQVGALRERLQASQALYQTDQLQIEFLLDAQEELAQTEKQLAWDRTRYALALVAVHDATGQLLAESGVFISSGNCAVSVISDPVPSSPAEAAAVNASLDLSSF